MIATADSWKRLPFGPVVSIPYTADYSSDDVERMRRGFVPEAMEDKWFIYGEGTTFFFHRSWTGMAVYRLELEPAGPNFRVKQALCCADIVAKNGGEQEARILGFLVANLLLDHAEPFPSPYPQGSPESALYQHSVSGTGFADAPRARRPWWKVWGRD